jgi:hypothetical protein
METLVAVLFIVFSIGSALLERRKRRQQVEKGRKGFQEREAQRQAEEARSGPQRVEVDVAEEEEEEEEWSFPSSGFDPFELQPAKPDPALLEIERQQHEAEHLAAEAEGKSRRLEEQAKRLKAESSATQAHYGKKRTGIKRKGRLIFEPRNVRDAIVYAEILGPPKAEREDNV